jgi:hypothetical protein
MHAEYLVRIRVGINHAEYPMRIHVGLNLLILGPYLKLNAYPSIILKCFLNNNNILLITFVNQFGFFMLDLISLFFVS